MFRNYPDPLLDLREPFVEEMSSIFIPMLDDGSGTRLQIFFLHSSHFIPIHILSGLKPKCAKNEVLSILNFTLVNVDKSANV